MRDMEDLVVCSDPDCLTQVLEDRAVYASQEAVFKKKDGVTCSICGCDILVGQNLLVQQEDDVCNNKLYCCDVYCSNDYVKDSDDWVTAGMNIVQKIGSCGVCGRNLPEQCFELVVSEPK